MSDSSDEEHPYVKYGTPLPEVDETTVKPSNLKSTVPIFDQIVTDEQGRRRFHGAFTGGFSAGYYNTVGTKEGWVPTSFKSSRSSKSDKKVFSAQDFMDEEDMGDFGIAPKSLSTKDEFTSGRKRTAIEEKQLKFQEDKLTLAFGTELMESLVIPVRSNIGIKLLRNMGWKDGQGLGPHVRRRKKKKVKKPENNIKVYGCSLPGRSNMSDSEDEYIPDDFKFAPKDQMPVTVTYKDDHHGIGYSGLDPTAALHKKVKKSTAVKAKTKAGSKLSFFGQAFGVGAYEEEDDDIYAQDSISNYDAIMGEEKNPDDTYGWTKPLAITGGPEFEAIGLDSTTKVLFVPAKRQSKLYPKVYPPPDIPNNFDPFRRLKLKEGTKRISNMNLSQKASNPPLPVSSTPSHLTSDDRRSMLSDSKSPESPKKVQSVFDFISWEDRQKLEEAKRKPIELGFKGKPETVQLEEQKVDRTTPLCKPSSLKPFADNPEKLRRYEEYERAVRQRKRDPYSSITSNLTEWERRHERDEFARLAQVYLHLASNINSKFTKAVEEENEEIQEGLQTKPAETKMKAFGIMTHSTTEWHPDPLLCKRFNVPDPYPNSEMVGSEQPSGTKYLSKLQLTYKQEDVAKKKDVKEMEAPKAATGIISDTVRPPMFEKSRPLIGGRWDKQPAFVGPLDKRPDETKSDDENQPTEENDESSERPSMDLFKSIFASSEEESSEDEEEPKDGTESPKQASPQDAAPDASKSPASTNERISAADVFMKPLPFKEDQNSVKDVNPPVVPSTTNQSTETNIPEEDVDFFGPVLPPPNSKPFVYSNFNHHEDDDDDKAYKSNKHKKHKKHKHKKKKKKS